MTKKDFNELAKQLAIVKQEIDNPTDEYLDAAMVWVRCREAVMRACRTTSANFDPQRFREACNK